MISSIGDKCPNINRYNKYLLVDVLVLYFCIVLNYTLDFLLDFLLDFIVLLPALPYK